MMMGLETNWRKKKLAGNKQRAVQLQKKRLEEEKK